jgi:large subunit ribosomal protein L4
VNKKVSRLARRSALTYKARDSKVLIVEQFDMEAPKTKQFLSILSALEVDTAKVLLVLPDDNKNIYLSCRNIPKANVIRAQDLNTYDILNADRLVFVEGSVEKVQQQLG